MASTGLKRIRHKFSAVATKIGQQRFDSKKEARRYMDLQHLRLSREVVFFIRQTRFDLPGGLIWRADFVVFWKDGSVTVEDVKGLLRRLRTAIARTRGVASLRT